MITCTSHPRYGLTSSHNFQARTVIHARGLVRYFTRFSGLPFSEEERKPLFLRCDGVSDGC